MECVMCLLLLQAVFGPCDQRVTKKPVRKGTGSRPAVPPFFPPRTTGSRSAITVATRPRLGLAASPKRLHAEFRTCSPPDFHHRRFARGCLGPYCCASTPVFGGEYTAGITNLSNVAPSDPLTHAQSLVHKKRPPVGSRFPAFQIRPSSRRREAPSAASAPWERRCTSVRRRQA